MTMPSEQPAAGGDGGPAGRFLQLGKLEGRLVCSPDLDQLLSCASDSLVSSNLKKLGLSLSRVYTSRAC